MDNKITPRKVGFFYFFSKYTFDFLVSLISIIILLPAFIIIGIIVKCSSKGPIFFVDKRVGKNEKMIGVLKFRTMYVDAETNIEKYLSPEQIKAWKEERKLENDPRITKIGNFLRKSSLDELPQLFNILVGQMSIVGPRPISKREYDAYYNDEEKKSGNYAYSGSDIYNVRCRFCPCRFRKRAEKQS